MKFFQLLAACDPSVAAAPAGHVRTCDIGVSAVTDANTLVPNILSTVYTWAGIIAVLVIVVGGYFYATSQGNAAQIKRAKDAIMGAVIGLVVVIMAFVITQFVIGRF